MEFTACLYLKKRVLPLCAHFFARQIVWHVTFYRQQKENRMFMCMVAAKHFLPPPTTTTIK